IAQRPERLFRSRRLVSAVVALAAVLLTTSFVDIPWLKTLAEPSYFRADQPAQTPTSAPAPAPAVASALSESHRRKAFSVAQCRKGRKDNAALQFWESGCRTSKWR